MIAGVDGCKSGWIAVIERDGGEISVEPFETFGQVLDCKGLTLIVIDIPIGLPGSGSRPADKQARAILHARGCCVFPAPIRPVLACRNRLETSEKWERIDGRRCGVQLWSILPKIAQVDELMRCAPHLQERVREGHPEVSFAVMSGKPVMKSKRRREGQALRVKLLQRYFPDVMATLSQHPAARVDVLDAYAMLWTARRVRSKTAIALPPNPDPDSCGLKPQIFA